ncbi:unnamed protein product, partial [Tetraodon nigroviridis]
MAYGERLEALPSVTWTCFEAPWFPDSVYPWPSGRAWRTLFPRMHQVLTLFSVNSPVPPPSLLYRGRKGETGYRYGTLRCRISSSRRKLDRKNWGFASQWKQLDELWKFETAQRQWQSDNSGGHARPRPRSSTRSVLHRHQGYRKWLLRSGLPGSPHRQPRDGGNQEGPPGQEVQGTCGPPLRPGSGRLLLLLRADALLLSVLEQGAADHEETGPLQHREVTLLLLFQWGEGERGPTGPLLGRRGPRPPHLCFNRSPLFSSLSFQKDEVYLNLVLDFVPETVYRVARHFNKAKTTIPIIYVKRVFVGHEKGPVYMYQLFRSLAYIHSQGVCHRDIKPQNLLVDPETAILKLCDFGSAKQLVRGEPNVSYICSRYYRAPELIFGATDYTSNIDIWSAGCVLAELLLGQPIFPGDSGVDQLVEIIKVPWEVLGTPTREQIREMNPNYTEFKFPQIKAHPWTKVFKPRTPPEAIALCSRLLEYTPVTRLSPLEACAHAFFDELRQPNTRLPSGRELPLLFNFSPVGQLGSAADARGRRRPRSPVSPSLPELSIQPQLNSTLIPPHARAQTS